VLYFFCPILTIAKPFPAVHGFAAFYHKAGETENGMQLKMYRPAKLEIPVIEPPKGYTIREMRPGEEAEWCRCCIGEFGVTEASEEVYYSKMDKNEVVPGNVFFACSGDRPVGTATALEYSPGVAYLHYIAVNPEHRGKGLTYPLISKVLLRHREQGRLGCFLTTDDFRIPAVKSYLKFGYLPVLWSDDARERWERLGAMLGYDRIPAFDAAMRPAPDVICRK
jgi:mycothiol synthase